MNFKEPLVKIRKHSQQITNNEVDYYKYICLLDYHCEINNIVKVSKTYSFHEISKKIESNTYFKKIEKQNNFRKEIVDLYIKKHYIKLIFQILMNIDYF